MTRRKYGNKPTTVDNILFASKGEATRYIQLKSKLQKGEIEDLELQPRYPLVINDVKIGTYIGDFRYKTSGLIVVEDYKGMETPVFKLKAKLVYALYGIQIRVVK